MLSKYEKCVPITGIWSKLGSISNHGEEVKTHKTNS